MSQIRNSPFEREAHSGATLLHAWQELGPVEHAFRAQTQERQARRQLKQMQRLQERFVAQNSGHVWNEQPPKSRGFIASDGPGFNGGDVIIED